ncbi:hypothetical protein [Pseudogemmobacter bohemicus]|uniref:hypothetical protein n=1 Tax=Pseudogemmobacter bohemicus TaxID=2250708 RepID=UPI001300274E|nr:hypothetical protein [Pseudogemmobacter bohemicus]
MRPTCPTDPDHRLLQAKRRAGQFNDDLRIRLDLLRLLVANRVPGCDIGFRFN